MDNLFEISPPANPEVEVGYYFPKHRESKEINHPLSEPLEIIINAKNDGDTIKEIKIILAYLSSITSPNDIIQKVYITFTLVFHKAFYWNIKTKIRTKFPLLSKTFSNFD